MATAISMEAVRARLDAIGQGHLLRFAHDLPEGARARLLADCSALPLEIVAREAAAIAGGEPAGAARGASSPLGMPASIEPAEVIPWHPAGWSEFAAAGERLLRAGKVACFTVAGGQGTRLGWDAPKGTFPASPITQKSLFQLFAEGIRGLRERHGAPLDWIVMTSPQNDAATRQFFEAHGWFGLRPGTVRFVVQGTLPALGLDGRILLAGRDQLASSPDGHGGSLRALAGSGELARLREAGVEHLSYFQVDNPLAHPADPLFLGLHAAHPASGAQMSSRSVSRSGAGEKVGVFCRRGGRVEVVEYSDLPAALAGAVLDDGRLLHSAGNIAVHALSISFIESLTRGGFALPIHHAHKRVPCLGEDGLPHEPAAPNAVKLETFIFDALPLADRPIVVDSLRGEWFAPIKNASGADSAETSRAAQVARAAGWLETLGTHVPRTPSGDPDCLVEVSPDVALSAEDLRAAVEAGRVTLPPAVAAGSSLLVTCG